MQKIRNNLKKSLQLICKIDNKHPGEKHIQELYDIVFEIYEYLKKH